MIAPSNLDAIDRRIIRYVQENARISFTELAEKVGLSVSPCLRRVKRLEEEGIIRGYATLISQDKIGLPVNVFVGVKLERQSVKDLEEFEQQIKSCREVMECYFMSGDSDYHLRVVTKDLGAYERFLMNVLTRIPGVANVKSSFALRQVSYRTALPLCAALGLSDVDSQQQGLPDVRPRQHQDAAQ